MVTAARGDITEEVTVTGKTKAAENVSLGFERGGKVTQVLVDVGTPVIQGQALVGLDQSELVAQLSQAQASVHAAQAKLDELKRGARPEDLAVQQADFKKAEQDLQNEYAGIRDIVHDAYTKADDAVRKQTSGIFSGDGETNPQLTFSIFNLQIESDIRSQRLLTSQELNKWKNELVILATARSDSDLRTALHAARAHSIVVRDFLNRVMDGLVANNSLSAGTVSTYQANITTGRTNVNAALTAINNQDQRIASQEAIVQKSQNELNLKLAGSDPEEIKAQEAEVDRAKGQVALIKAQISKMVLTSPINGVVTLQDAKRGQIVGANTPIVSIISQNKLHIEANVPEVDIGKLAVANPVGITLDALPGVTLTGKVIHIDPAETIIDGVVNYKVNVEFDKTDERIKSGLTANLSIQTAQKSGVVLLPQFAILENDQGTFVRKLEGGEPKEYPVTLGIRSQKGQVEIRSGVAEGDRVLNIGAKNSPSAIIPHF